MYERTLVLPLDALPECSQSVLSAFGGSTEDLLMMLFVTYVLNPLDDDTLWDAFADIVYGSDTFPGEEHGGEVLDECTDLYWQFKFNVDPYLSYLHDPIPQGLIEVTHSYARPGIVVVGLTVTPYKAILGGLLPPPE